MRDYGTTYMDEIDEKVYLEGIAAKESGRKVVGIYCAFTPHELIAAAGAIPVSLCAGSEKPISKAEEHLPRNLCPLIKASYGFALTEACPYFNATDFLVADATCDGKKKMFELMNRIRPLHLLQLPQTYETEESLDYWISELHKIQAFIEDKTGNRITEEGLWEQIDLYNGCRAMTLSIYEMNRGAMPKLTGREIIAITGSGGFEVNLEDRLGEMALARQDILERAETSEWQMQVKNKRKIMLTGCPVTNRKLLNVLEDSGAIVVAMESCGGLKTVGDRVEHRGDPWHAMGVYYLNTACPCMTPNPKRLEIISDIIEGYGIDGVVELVWQGCHTYNIEAFQIKEHIREHHGKPYLQIETDYSESDLGQIRLRVEAFLELIN